MIYYDAKFILYYTKMFQDDTFDIRPFSYCFHSIAFNYWNDVQTP